MSVSARLVRARRSSVLLGVIVTSLFVASPAEATRVRSLGLADMADRAGRIFVGRCTSRNVEVDPATRLPVTTYVFAVTDPIKGVGRGPTSIRLPGTPSQPFLYGLPIFDVGEEALLILYPESGAGFSSPIGLGQGRFRLLRRADGSASALNGRRNERILNDVPDAVLRSRRLARDDRGPLDLERLTGILRDLVAKAGP